MTRLERAITPLCEDHPGECGILALDDSLDAFAARYRLTEMAERTLDVPVLHLGKRHVRVIAIFRTAGCSEARRTGAFAAG
ncbi:phospholipase [Citrobacter braakii]|nr:phospholipase [Citrobacter braakii]